MQENKSRILLARPEDVRYPLTLSVSKSKTFKDCKAKYRFAYIEKLPRKDRDYHIFGKFLHQALELFYKEIINKSDDPYNIIMTRSFKSAYENWKEKLTAEQFQEAKLILSSFLNKIIEESDNEKEIIFLSAEKEFYIDIDGKILLNGYIDRIQLDSDGILHVTDYKTTKNKKYLKNDYFQLLTYAFVMCLENPELEKVRTSYILLRHNSEMIIKEFTRDQIMKIESIFLDYADKIHNEKLFRANPTKLCSWCEYLDHCEDGQQAVGVLKFGASKW